MRSWILLVVAFCCYNVIEFFSSVELDESGKCGGEKAHTLEETLILHVSACCCKMLFLSNFELDEIGNFWRPKNAHSGGNV